MMKIDKFKGNFIFRCTKMIKKTIVESYNNPYSRHENIQWASKDR